MASFDVVNELDLQELDNAINSVIKESDQRYDFRGSGTEIELNKKDKVIKVVTGDDMKVQAIKEMTIKHATKRGIDGRVFEFSEPENTSKGQRKFEIKANEGLGKDNAKKIVKMIKELKLKVNASIMDDRVRVEGKKLDDLQAVMNMLKATSLEVPVQFVNMKS
ncbi:MAG: YajQ family cyclic di-GMP-binding protein [Denitrovibrio sp.]|nr:MAG: YajQ family cyclic di-GMP-binding protein [Denitrovibrio sp.]